MADQTNENHSHIVSGSPNYHSGAQTYGTNLHGASTAFRYDGVLVRNLVDPWDLNESRNTLTSSQIEKLVNEAVIKAKNEIYSKIDIEIHSAVDKYLEQESKDTNGKIKKIITDKVKEDVQKKVEFAIENDVEKSEEHSFMKQTLRRIMGDEINSEFSQMREENTTKIFTILGAVIGILSFIFISVNVVTQVETLRSALILILAMAFLLISFMFAMNLILVDKERNKWSWWVKFAFMITLLGMILLGAFNIKGGLNEKSQKNQLESLKKDYDEKLQNANSKIETLNEQNQYQSKVLECLKNKGFFSNQCY